MGGGDGEAWLGPDRKLQGIVEMEGKQIFKNERLMKQVRIQNKSDCKMESCCLKICIEGRKGESMDGRQTSGRT